MGNCLGANRGYNMNNKESLTIYNVSDQKTTRSKTNVNQNISEETSISNNLGKNSSSQVYSNNLYTSKQNLTPKEEDKNLAEKSLSNRVNEAEDSSNRRKSDTINPLSHAKVQNIMSNETENLDNSRGDKGFSNIPSPEKLEFVEDCESKTENLDESVATPNIQKNNVDDREENSVTENFNNQSSQPSQEPADSVTSKLQETQNSEDGSKLQNALETSILNLQEHFTNFNPEDIQYPKNSLEYIRELENWAKQFEDKIANYLGTNYSVDYFIIDENLTRFVECLDKIKLQQDEHLFKEKLRVIKYIRDLQSRLDENATEK